MQKLYVLAVTLSTGDSVKLSKQLDEGFKRSVYWNKYKVIDNSVAEIAATNTKKYKKERLDASYQEVKRLLVLVYDNKEKVIIKFLLILSKNISSQE